MNLSSLRTGERIAAGAAVLLLVDLFLKWYGVDLGDALGEFAGAAGIDTSVSGWEAFSFTDVLLFVIVTVVLALVALHAGGRSPALPVSRSAIIAVLGAIATLWVLWRVVNEPGSDKLIDLKIGAYLGVVFAAGIAFGGWRAMQEEGLSLQDARDQAQRAVGGRGTSEPAPAPPAATAPREEPPATPPPPAPGP